VFDCGFARPNIVEYLAQIRVLFYLRIKSIKRVAYKGMRKKSKEFSERVDRVHAYGLDMTLAVTALPRTGKGTELWYIISNDVRASLMDIRTMYYYLFEIEELFRDAKRMFGLEYIHFTKPDDFATVLWFVIAGMWFQTYLDDHLNQVKSVIKRCKASFNQSTTHYWLEQIKYPLQAPALALITITDG
jgi:hypothetical protein